MEHTLTQLLTKLSGLTMARLAGAALVFAGNIAIVRYFGAETLGLFALTIAVASLVGVVLPLGRQAVGVMFVSEYLAKERSDLVQGYANAGHRLIAVTSAVILSGAALALFALGGQFDPEHVLVAGFAIATAPALAIINFDGSLLSGAGRQFSAFLPETLLKPVFLVLTIPAAAYLFAGDNLQVLLGITCLGYWLTAGLQHWLINKHAVVSRAAKKSREPGRWQAAALPWMITSLLWDYFIELHLILAGMMATTAEIAILHICFRLRVLAGFGMRSLYALVLPGLYRFNARGDMSSFSRNLALANLLALVYSVLTCFAVMALGGVALGLVDDSFREAHLALIIFCLTMIPRALFGPAPALLAMKGHQLPTVWCLSGGLFVSITLCLLLFPLYGITGIAIAYTTANTLVSILQWRIAKYLTGLDSSILNLRQVNIGELLDLRAFAPLGRKTQE